MRVLIAEDEPLARRAMEAKLNRWGYETLPAENGNEAWEILQREDAPRLALLDWTMPILSGPELCKKIRAAEFEDYVYVILLTGKDRTEDIVEGMDAGADDYVVKPFKSEELKARLRAAERILDLHAKVRQEHRAREQAQEQHIAEIQQREARLKAILSSLHETIIVVHDRGDVVKNAWGDAELNERYGIDIATMPGQQLSDVFRPEDIKQRNTLIQSVFDTGNPARREHRHTLPGGEFWHDMSLCPMRDPSGKVVAVVAFMQDITERKRMQEELLQARRLEAVGQLAAGIAHEINTPLQYTGDNTRFVQESFKDISEVIGASSQLLEESKTDEVIQKKVTKLQVAFDNADVSYLLEEVPQAMQQSLEGIERVTKIVRAMKEFSHPGVKEKAAVDINKSLDSTITICRNEWKYVAEVQTNLDASLPPVQCFPGELNQVFLNLIINAAHAIAEVTNGDSDAKGTITVNSKRSGECVEIRISDTGAGIPDEIRPRIFDPFFTTKQVGKGTGQGLTMAHSVIVEKHGGTIDFESEVGKGTTFIVRIPFDPKPAKVAEPSAHPVSV